MMKRKDAEQAIIRDWKALPETERQTEEQAALFAMKIKDKYPFRYSGDRYQAVHGMIIDYQIRIGARR